MIPSTACPDSNQLASFLSGNLPYLEVEQLARHLEDCPNCSHEIERLDIDDPLAATIRPSIIASSDADEERIDSLIHLISQSTRIAGNSESNGDAHNTLWDVGSVLVQPDRPGFLGRIGPFWILKLLGAGGMGEVYLAQQERPKRPVALKILRGRLGSDRELLARFQAEADAAARLRHPNIVQVYQSGESNEAAFIAMELVEGGNLTARLVQAVMSPRDAARLLSTLAQAVEFAHQNGVVHRDLKPSNVLLDRDSTPKLSDFGLAKILMGTGSEQTKTGAVIGTPAYMAPEQVADGKTVGPSADVYGLGAILYECLTGRPPFKAASPLETLEQVRTHEPIPPRRLQHLVDRDLETICLKCLEKEPGRRYSSAATLAQDLDCFLRGEPIRARRIGLFLRGWKLARRRPTIAGLVLVSCFLAIGMVALSVRYTARLSAEVDRANNNSLEATRQKERAATNYRSAKNTLTLMLHRLDERRAGDIPRLMELRRDQLEDALAFYENSLGHLDDHDPELQLDTALALTRAGEIRNSLGRKKESEESFQHALSLFEGLPDEIRMRPECLEGMVHCFKNLAFQALDRPKVSHAYFLRALSAANSLCQLNPSDARWLDDLASVEHDFGQHFTESGDTDTAEEHYLRAIEIRTGLIERNPDVEGYRAELGEDWINLGLIYSGKRNDEKTANAFSRADQLLSPLVKTHPGDDSYGLSYAALLVNWANHIRGTDLPQALAKLDRAVELADAALQREPGFNIAKSRSREAHGSRAHAREQANRLEEAIEDWERVILLAEEKERLNYRMARAILLLRSGKEHLAVAEAYAIRVEPLAVDDHLYNVACIMARAAEPMKNAPGLGVLASAAAAETHANSAMQILRQLHATGYFLKPSSTKLLTEDSDFDSLRRRADFKTLLIDNTMKPK